MALKTKTKNRIEIITKGVFPKIVILKTENEQN